MLSSILPEPAPQSVATNEEATDLGNAATIYSSGLTTSGISGYGNSTNLLGTGGYTGNASNDIVVAYFTEGPTSLAPTLTFIIAA